MKDNKKIFLFRPEFIFRLAHTNKSRWISVEKAKQVLRNSVLLLGFSNRLSGTASQPRKR